MLVFILGPVFWQARLLSDSINRVLANYCTTIEEIDESQVEAVKATGLVTFSK